MVAKMCSGSATAEAVLMFAQNMVAGVPFPIALLDSDLRYVAASESWVRYIGQEVDRVIGHLVDDFLPSGENLWRSALSTAQSGTAASGVERVHQPPPGADLWMTWKVWPIHPSCTWVAVSLTVVAGEGCLDVNMQPASPSVQEITSTLGIGVLEYDFLTGVTSVTDTYLALLGLRRETLPTTDAEWISFFRVRNPTRFLADRARALDPDGDGRLAVEVWPMVSGVERHMLIKARVLFEGEKLDRRPRHLVGILIDRTEEQQLLQALERAQRLESVGRIAGMVAHDFNNILTVILGYLELAEPKEPDATVRELLHKALEATKMGAGFNRRLLALAGKNGGDLATFHLDRHLGETWEVFRRVLRDDIELQFEPGAGTAHVHADPAEVDAAVLNLVVNARDAQPNGGQIVISTQIVIAEEVGLSTGPDKFAKISVADDGEGMPPEVAERVGEPFFTTKPAGKGSGLGLTSVIKMAERIGGTFKLETGSGGTRASILLPICAAEVNSVTTPKEDIPLGEGEVVMVVEDDPRVREAAMQRLEELGYVVTEASNAQAALDLLEAEEQVDLVFSDIALPGGVTGIDLVQKIKREWPHVALLLTSGHNISSDHQSLANPCLPELLRKPYSMRELAAAIRRGLSFRA